MKRINRTVPKNTVALTLGLIALTFAPIGQTPIARADDRDLFRQSASGAPYLFILFDLSGSMNSNLAGRGTALHGDDHDSRLFQAKEALDLVLQDAEGVNFGFATFPNHFRLRVNNITQVRNLGRRVVPFESTPSRWCEGIESNADSLADKFQNYSVKYPTTRTPNDLEIGDLVPFNWDDNNVGTIRQRLAPNLALGETDPDFGIARYFRDSGSGPSNSFFLPLLDERARPLLTTAAARTPLAAALLDFQAWYADWKPKAVANDPESACRRVAVVLLTDGVETCNGRPVDAAGTLQATGIDTYVIGFANNNPALDDIAAAGGTTEAYDASNQQELIDALNEILAVLQRQSRTFSTAAVPSVIGTAADNIYLTSFSPTDDGVSLWPGRVDAYKKPVPLVSVFGQQVPNRNQVCSDPDTDENCLAWDAATKLLEQAPSETEVESNLQIGNGTTQRRVYWGADDPMVTGEVPRVRQFFQFPSTDALEDEFYGDGFGISPVPLPAAVGRAAFLASGESIVKYFLKEKQALVLNPITRVEETVTYVMSDIFHSDPALVAEPKRFDYFAKDLEGEIEPCGTTNNTKDRYPCFVKNLLGRRRVLLFGSNEGAFHALNAGSAFRSTEGFIEYTAGNGQELFAYVPRSVMPAIHDMSIGGGQQFTVDGPVTIDDVLRDLEVNDVSGPDPAQREWRTVAIAGLREGGAAYFALDVTQPDVISGTGLPIPATAGPGCAAPGACDRVYPEILWEFTDTWDEDNNGAVDLADAWSKVNTGRIRIDDGTDADGNPKTRDMYVAVFGGGMDREFKVNPVANPLTGKFEVSGNFLYMVDIETGKLVYKRRIDNIDAGVLTSPASAPSEPAAVDTDQDSYLDTIYIGNTAGYLYKVDISEAVPLAEDITVLDYARIDPATGTAGYPETVDRIIDTRWDPFPIFDTEGRPIFNAPSVIFVSELARYALAFGTGDREDLWSDEVLGGRFYVLLDNDLRPDSGDPSALPLDASDLEGFVATNVGSGNAAANLLENPNAGFNAGYYLILEPDERLINKSFGLSGVLFFSTYLPELVTGEAGACGSSGSSRLYSVYTTNGTGLRAGGQRFKDVGDFVTQPYVESSGAVDGAPSDPTVPAGNASACSSDELQEIRTSLMSQMPAQCNFAQYSLDVMTLQSQSGVECQLQIPVCVVGRNWKEF